MLNKKLRNAVFDYSQFKDLDSFRNFFGISKNFN
jgi:hypothetical protein